MGDNDIIINVRDSLTNPSLLFVPKRFPPSSLNSPSLGSIVTSDFNQKSNKTVSPKDDWSAIVQPSISNRRLPGCRTGSYNSFDSFNARMNDLNSEYPTMRQLHSTAVSMWSLEESVAKHISNDFMMEKNRMFESVIYPSISQKGSKLPFYKPQRKFSCPALFQLQDLSVDPKIFYQNFTDKIPNKDIESTRNIPTNIFYDSIDQAQKQSSVFPSFQTQSKNYRYKCESWLREIRIVNFPEN